MDMACKFTLCGCILLYDSSQNPLTTTTPIIEPLDQGKPPDRVHQRDIARTRCLYLNPPFDQRCSFKLAQRLVAEGS